MHPFSQLGALSISESQTGCACDSPTHELRRTLASDLWLTFDFEPARCICANQGSCIFNEQVSPLSPVFKYNTGSVALGAAIVKDN